MTSPSQGAPTSHAGGPTRTALALRHVHFEDLGVFEPVLQTRGYRVDYVDVGVDAIESEQVEGADLLIVLGGPIGVSDVDRYPYLGTTKALISRRLHVGRPTLGICLGAQLIAEALGARVRRTGEVEIGYRPLGVTTAGSRSPLRELDGVPVLHWHGDEFEIPEGAELLAGTPGFPHQAFRTDSVLALQFHLETDHRAIERWLIGHAHELQHWNIDPRLLRAQALREGPRAELLARTALGTWLDDVDRLLVGDPRKDD